MPLEVFCGRFHPELEEAFLERLRARPPGIGRRIAIVAPSRRLADILQRRIVESGASAFNARFHTFFSLALEIVAGLPGEDALMADGFFHDKVVDLLLRERSARRKWSRGLASAYRSSLRDLVDAGVDGASLAEHFGDYLKEERLSELLELERLYLDKLATLKVMPPAGLTRRAAAAIAAGEAAALDAYDEVIYYGFYDLTGAQADFFSAVAGAADCAVFFPYAPERQAYAFARRFFDLKLAGGRTTFLPERSTGPLGRGLACLFEPGQSAPPPDCARVRILSAAGSHDEAWAAAKEILSWFAQGIEFSRMGVVARTLEPYRAAISQVFSEHAIPFWTSAEEPLLAHPAAKLALTLLRLRRLDYPVGRVFDVFESPYFRARRFGGAEAVSRWKRLTGRLGVHSGWLQWTGKVSAWAARDFPLGPKEIVPAKDNARLWRLMSELHERLDPARAAAWSEHGTAARAMIEDFFEVDDGEAWSGVLSALEELAPLALLFERTSWSDFLDAFEEKLARKTFASPRENFGVRVLDAMEARGESFDALVLIGLTDGLFPRSVREDPLLQDDVRAKLRHPAGYWIGEKLEGYDEEKLLFAMLAGSARERLSCVYERSDDDGRAQVPSIYLRELCRASRIDLERSAVRVARQPFARIESVPEDLRSPKEIALLTARGGRGAEELLAALGLDGETFALGLETARELGRGGAPGALDGLVGPDEAAAKRLGRDGFSPTALETFSACPFQFFASRVLGLGQDKEPSERGELAPWLKGMLYHRVLQGFHAALAREGFWPEARAAWRPVLEREIEAAFAENGWKELGLYPLLWTSLKARMSESLIRFVEFDLAEIKRSGLVPARFESELRREVGGRLFAGKIDRIDADEAGRRLRVIDYKTRWGASRPSLEKLVLSMAALQAPIYLELAALAYPDYSLVDARYYPIEEQDEGRRVQEFSGAAWRKSRERLRENLAAFIAQIERGEFFITPEDGRGGVCERCDFRWVCRKAHPVSRRRAEASRLRSEFDRRHEVKA